MKILLLSDTHGEWERTRQILDLHADADMFIHLGDIGFAKEKLANVLIVKGNHDKDPTLPREYIFSAGERKILCLHGNCFEEEVVNECMKRKQPPNENILAICMDILCEKLAAYAKEKQCDTVFFGHLHIQIEKHIHGIDIINPGSLSSSLKQIGYAVINIETKRMIPHFYTWDGLCAPMPHDHPIE